MTSPSRSKKPHVIIVGGSSGTGSVVAKTFFQRGYSVSIIGRRPRPELKTSHYFQADLADKASLAPLLKTIVAQHGKWDSLVFVQRFRGPGPSWEGEWQVGVEATQALLEAAPALCAAQGNRSVVIFNSVVSQFIDPKQEAGYHASKAAIRQLVQFYAVRLGPKGIRVNGVSPATILKPSSAQKVLANRKLMAAYKNFIPLGRMGRASEMASAAFFLCGPDASYITGHNLTVDGGISLLAQEGLIRELTLS